MKILVMEFKIRVSYVNSLKEKRMIVRSLKDKLRNNFNVSVSETGDNDNHKSIVLGICSVSNDKTLLQNLSEKTISFIENNFDVEIVDIYSEIELY